MSGFRAYLRARIEAEGPQPIERVMAEALGHPEHGYYITRDPFGAGGDFITAPDISQMFGELVGLWCARTHEQMGAPARLRLVELGPGRGSLMADALRATARLATFRDAIELHLVETSPALRDVQRRTLGDAAVHWHDRLDSIPDGPAIIIANEFFDALPVRQFLATRQGWRERLVALAEGPDAFRFTESAEAPPELPSWPPDARALPAGAIAEDSPARAALAAAIGRRLSDHGGAALVIDYGHAASAPGDTLQAVKAHRKVPVLDTLGEADLTAHVDFAALARAATAAGARAWGPVRQGDFLLALGIETRAARLLARASTAQAAAIETALHRLTALDQMGALFKALALTQPDAAMPEGFTNRGTEGGAQAIRPSVNCPLSSDA
ncbi:MAG: class I SAM-dependent methyltransferase [Alphaproteobacteria bacterium]